MAALDTAVRRAAEPDRQEQAACIAYVSDAASEAMLREGLTGVGGGLEVHRGGIKAALVALQRLATPRVLIVDVSGEESPLASLESLSALVEPHVCVLVTGELSGLDFYREVTRSVGAAEYLAKPLTREMVSRHFAPLAEGRAAADASTMGGRVITVTGVHGGAGATTLAVNLAWHFGITARRHTVLLDPDTLLGDATFLLNIQAGHGLDTVLQAPDRIDMLLAERAAQPVDDRLHVLAGQETLDATAEYAAGAAEKLLAALRHRYNFIVADAPFRPMPLYRDLLAHANRRVLVMEPTLAAVRNARRLIELPAPGAEYKHPVVVLNRLGRPAGLGRTQIEDALEMKVDLVVPDMPKLVNAANNLGKPAVTEAGPFRDAILELSRRVAFTRLLDTKGYWSKAPQQRKGLLAPFLRARK
ncbi:MAG: AAA family ATPase [Janthinobacterium lividum]